MNRISVAAAASLPDSLPFAKYARHAAERRAQAITLTGDDFEALAAMVREAQAVLAADALDMSDLEAFMRPPDSDDRMP